MRRQKFDTKTKKTDTQKSSRVERQEKIQTDRDEAWLLTESKEQTPPRGKVRFCREGERMELPFRKL